MADCRRRMLAGFRDAWLVLEWQGEVDDYQSAQCFRARGDWIRAGYPADVVGWLAEWVYEESQFLGEDVDDLEGEDEVPL